LEGAAVDITEIDVDELERRLAQGAHVVDVREPDEFETARIPGVLLIPLSDFESRLEEIPTDETTYFVCAKGGRSMRAAEFAAARLSIHAVNVAGGTNGWLAAGKPFETGR
jgi:rhodanese-related sulfurtransferase